MKDFESYLKERLMVGLAGSGPGGYRSMVEREDKALIVVWIT